MSFQEVSGEAGGGRNGGLVAIALKELMNLKASLEYQTGELDRCIRVFNWRDYPTQQIPNLKTEAKLDSPEEAPEAEIENLRASDWEAELNARRDGVILGLRGLKEVLQREESEVTAVINGLARPEIHEGDCQMRMINLLKKMILSQERSTKVMSERLLPRENGIGIRSRM